jgi:hypothetical protein
MEEGDLKKVSIGLIILNGLIFLIIILMIFMAYQNYSSRETSKVVSATQNSAQTGDSTSNVEQDSLNDLGDETLNITLETNITLNQSLDLNITDEEVTNYLAQNDSNISNSTSSLTCEEFGCITELFLGDLDALKYYNCDCIIPAEIDPAATLCLPTEQDAIDMGLTIVAC